MPYVAVDDLTIYYEEHGLTDGPPLVLTHGFHGVGAVWEPQVAAFGLHYRLLAPDLRGHGRTDNPGGLPAMNHRRFGRDIIAFCRARGIERAVFCGESTGAMLLLTLSLEAPELARALIFSGGTYYFSDQNRAWWAEQTPDTIVKDREMAQARHTALGPDHWRRLAEAFIALHTHERADDFPTDEELTTIRTPTLIIHGDRDSFFPVEVPAGLYRLLPDAELCILPHTGHVPPAERPDWFNTIALDFLTRRLNDGE